jgi:hypothetical protein
VADHLTPREEAAVEALAVATSVRAAARATDVSERTLWTYLRRPDFRRALAARRSANTALAAGVITSFAGQLAGRLIEQCNSEDPWIASTSVRAALSLLFGQLANIDIQDRLAALEARLEEREQQTPPPGGRFAQIREVPKSKGRSA